MTFKTLAKTLSQPSQLSQGSKLKGNAMKKSGAEENDAETKRAKALRKKRKQLHIVDEMTPERLEKAQLIRRGADGVIRCEDTPLHRLAARRALAPHDPWFNKILLDAGERYLEHWYLSGLSPISAQNLDRVSGSGTGMPGYMTPASERAAYHRQQFRRAASKLDGWFAAAVDAIVLREESVADVGRRVSGYGHEKMATAVALDRLRGGLAKLAALFYGRSIDLGAPELDGARHDSALRPGAGRATQKSPKSRK